MEINYWNFRAFRHSDNLLRWAISHWIFVAARSSVVDRRRTAEPNPIPLLKSRLTEILSSLCCRFGPTAVRTILIGKPIFIDSRALSETNLLLLSNGAFWWFSIGIFNLTNNSPNGLDFQSLCPTCIVIWQMRIRTIITFAYACRRSSLFNRGAWGTTHRLLLLLYEDRRLVIIPCVHPF